MKYFIQIWRKVHGIQEWWNLFIKETIRNCWKILLFKCFYMSFRVIGIIITGKNVSSNIYQQQKTTLIYHCHECFSFSGLLTYIQYFSLTSNTGTSTLVVLLLWMNVLTLCRNKQFSCVYIWNVCHIQI